MSGFEELADRPWRTSFYAALRRLERMHPDRPGFGRSRRPSEDPVRLGQKPSLRFEPAELADWRPAKGALPARLRVAFFGLFGPNGPLPTHLTEYVHDRLHNAGDPTIAAFLDIFHHRLLSLFYRAWADAQPVVHQDRGTDDGFARFVDALAGIGLPGLRHRDALPDTVRRFFAGVLVPAARSADGLSRLLSTHFAVPAHVLPFLGRWLPLPDSAYTRLGQGARLGHDAVLGRSLWDRRTTFGVALGPMDLRTFERCLPGGDWHERLRALIVFYVGLELDHDIQLILQQDEIPKTRLDGRRNLGWTSWLHSGSVKKNGSLWLRARRLQPQPVDDAKPAATTNLSASPEGNHR